MCSDRCSRHDRHPGGAFRALSAVMLSVAALALAVACAPVPGVGEAGDGETRSYSTDERPLDSFALIEQAVSWGRLDYETGLIYKVYAMFDPMNLPDEYASDVPGKCGTPVVAEVRQNWGRFTVEQRAELSRYVDPPPGFDEGDTAFDEVTDDRLEQERNKID